MAVAQTTPPAIKPVSEEELKAHLRVTSSAEDPEISAALEAAIAEIDGTGLLGRAMITQQFTQMSVPVASARDIELDITPAQSLDAVELVKRDGTIEAPDLAGFELISDGERAWIRAASGWPSDLESRPDAIRLTFTAGFGDTADDVPPTLRAAVKLLAAHRFEIRDEVVIGTITSQIPRGVDHLINLHRIRRFS